MAEPQITFRVPRALLALIEAEAERAKRSRTQIMLDVLADRFMGEDAPADRPVKRAKPAPKPAAPELAAKLSAKPERDLSPSLKDAPTSGAGKGGGMVSRLDLSVGNSRAPYQKGQTRAKAKG